MFLNKPSEIKVCLGVGNKFFIILSEDELWSLGDICIIDGIFWMDHFLERIDVSHLYDMNKSILTTDEDG